MWRVGWGKSLVFETNLYKSLDIFCVLCQYTFLVWTHCSGNCKTKMKMRHHTTESFHLNKAVSGIFSFNFQFLWKRNWIFLETSTLFSGTSLRGNTRSIVTWLIDKRLLAMKSVYFYLYNNNLFNIIYKLPASYNE